MAQLDTPAPPVEPADGKAPLVHRLRQRHRNPLTGHKHPVNKVHYEGASRGALIADRVSATIGSWPFIIIQSVLL